MAWFLGGGGSKTADEPKATKGQEIDALANKIIAERAARMAASTKFCATFVADVEAIVRRKIAHDPWQRRIVINANDVVNDDASQSKCTFHAICGTTKKELIWEETQQLLRAVRDAAVAQDYTVTIEDATVVLDFFNVPFLAKQRQLTDSAKWRGQDSIVRVLSKSQETK